MRFEQVEPDPNVRLGLEFINAMTYHNCSHKAVEAAYDKLTEMAPRIVELQKDKKKKVPCYTTLRRNVVRRLPSFKCDYGTRQVGGHPQVGIKRFKDVETIPRITDENVEVVYEACYVKVSFTVLLL